MQASLYCKYIRRHLQTKIQHALRLTRIFDTFRFPKPTKVELLTIRPRYLTAHRPDRPSLQKIHACTDKQTNKQTQQTDSHFSAQPIGTCA